MITISSAVYAVFINNAQVYKHERTFYFLVSGNPHLEVSGFEIKAENGAGYLLTMNDEEYVALSVYLNIEEGKLAQNSAGERFENLKIVSVKSENLYFVSRADKRKRQDVIDGLSSLLGGIRALSNEIERLEKGATQESSKRILLHISNTLGYLGEENQLFQTTGEMTVSAINESVAGVVYLKDLRYLLCELCIEYTRICAKFSL